MNRVPEVWEVGPGLVSIANALFMLDNVRKDRPKQVRVICALGLLGIFFFWILPVFGNWRLLTFRPGSPGYGSAITAFCLGSWVFVYFFRGQLSAQAAIWMLLGVLTTFILPKKVSDPAQLLGIQKTLFGISVYLMWVGLGTTIVVLGMYIYIFLTDLHHKESQS